MLPVTPATPTPGAASAPVTAAPVSWEPLPTIPGTHVPASRTVRFADQYLKDAFEGREFLLFDGGMGSMIQASSAPQDQLPELLNLTHPQVITDIHRQYVKAGSQVITTNTFGANARKLEGRASVAQVFAAAVACARNSGARYVAADLGPTGALLEPLGTLSFQEAYDLYAEQVHAAVDAGADLFVIETLGDLLEMKAAVLACKEHANLPIVASMTYGEDGRTFLGTSPQVATLTLCALGVNAVGLNCSLGPKELRPLVEEICVYATVPVVVQANAGLPAIRDGRTVYTITPEDYVAQLAPMVDAGVSIIGGCCGTNPEFIRLEAQLVAGRKPTFHAAQPLPSLTSALNAVVLRGTDVAVIGERINPTGKKKLKEALRTSNWDYILGEAISQTEAGADLLDLNAGLPEIDEASTLKTLVGQIQAVSPLPLQIDSTDPAAIEAAVRVYSGKPLINSVNGKEESLRAILPLAKHYGCGILGLCLDEDGIPSTAQGRFDIAQRICQAADDWGIPRSDVYIDCLVMSAATNQAEVLEILEAIRMCKERLGVRTVLGVSNISFGLPLRELVNATFLSAAFSAGLDMPILNPLQARYREVVDTWRVLCGQDQGGFGYIQEYANRVLPGASRSAASAGANAAGVVGSAASGGAAAVDAAAGSAAGSAAAAGGANAVDAAAGSTAPAAGHASTASSESESLEDRLVHCVLTGRKAETGAVAQDLLHEGMDPMVLINDVLIPALDQVGAKFEAGTFFLPQLMASAEAAKSAFDVVKALAPADKVADKGALAIATVKGDIHDIGKNIVRMLLENYGFEVFDLGRDVEPQAVLECVRTHDLQLVGLSALMTTTVKGMEETIALLRDQAPHVKIFVGGAVITPEYAQMVGADYYAKDAAESARIASEVLGG